MEMKAAHEVVRGGLEKGMGGGDGGWVAGGGVHAG